MEAYFQQVCVGWPPKKGSAAGDATPRRDEKTIHLAQLPQRVSKSGSFAFSLAIGLRQIHGSYGWSPLRQEVKAMLELAFGKVARHKVR